MSKLLWRELCVKYFNKVSEATKINEEELLDIDIKPNNPDKKPNCLLKTPSKITPPNKPIPPSNDECCGDGCRRCIFDIYYEQLENYEKELEEFKKLSY